MKRRSNGEVYLNFVKNGRTKKWHKTSTCNLCLEKFRPKTIHDRYCPACKEENQLLRFADDMPELDISLVEKVSA